MKASQLTVKATQLAGHGPALRDGTAQAVEAAHSTRRKLATILCADAVGFSRLMERDEEGTLRTLSASRDAIDRLIAAHAGRVFGGAGDSIVAEFGSAVEALRCAAAIQAELERCNRDLAEDRRMRFRVGLHLGDVMVAGENLLGDGVNVAARLQTLAEPGGICLSASVHDQVEGKLPLAFEPLGLQKVKNITKPVRAYHVVSKPKAEAGARVWTWVRKRIEQHRVAASFSALVLLLTGVGIAGWHHIGRLPQPIVPAASEATATFTKPAVAVLPFANLSGDPAQEHFSDGITEDIIVALGRFSNLAVIGRNSTASYKGRMAAADEIARDLGVRYLVAGSIRRAGDRVRITVELTEARRGLNLWSERFDRELADVFAVQDEIVKQVVGRLAVRVTRVEQERANAKPPANLDAYDYVLRGRELMSRKSRSATLEARRLFERATALDPKYAVAYSAQGFTYYHAAINGWTEFVDHAMRRAEALAQTALNLDADNADAYRLRGLVHLHRQQYDLALQEIEQSTNLNPNDAEGYAARGTVLLYTGHPAEAARLWETALRFDPSMYISFTLGLAYYLTGRYDDVIRAMKQSVARYPERGQLHVLLAMAYARIGHREEARRETAEVQRLMPFFDGDTFVTLLRDPAHRLAVTEGLRSAELTK